MPNGAKNAVSGGRQASGSRKGGNPKTAQQAGERCARLASRGGGPVTLVHAKGDGISEAVRANSQAAAETAKHKSTRVRQVLSSDEDDGLEAAGVVNVSRVPDTP
jgi:hypothetical protein